MIEEVEKLIGHGQDQTGTLHYTPRAKKVIELSMDEESYTITLLQNTYY